MNRSGSVRGIVTSRHRSSYPDLWIAGRGAPEPTSSRNCGCWATPRWTATRRSPALLVGQPTLRRRIKLGTFAALDQRIALRYAMTGMTREETTGYVRHHLELVGRSDTLFSDDALALIHQVSRGLPRAVNNLAVQALVAAYATKRAVVDESSARAAVTEVTTE